MHTLEAQVNRGPDLRLSHPAHRTRASCRLPRASSRQSYRGAGTRLCVGGSEAARRISVSAPGSNANGVRGRGPQGHHVRIMARRQPGSGLPAKNLRPDIAARAELQSALSGTQCFYPDDIISSTGAVVQTRDTEARWALQPYRCRTGVRLSPRRPEGGVLASTRRSLDRKMVRWRRPTRRTRYNSSRSSRDARRVGALLPRRVHQRTRRGSIVLRTFAARSLRRSIDATRLSIRFHAFPDCLPHAAIDLNWYKIAGSSFRFSSWSAGSVSECTNAEGHSRNRRRRLREASPVRSA